MYKYLKKIKERGMTVELLRDIIADHKPERDRMIKLYERYKASIEGVPILKRSIFEYNGFDIKAMQRVDDKVNNTLNNAFDADIIDTKVGYFLGHPISYGYDDGTETKPGEESPTMKEVNTFNLRNHVEDADAELGKMAAICGQSARLLYIEKGTGYEKLKNIDPWQVIFIGDDIHEPEYSIRYYKDGDKDIAEFYDDENITTYEAEKSDYKEIGSTPHLYKFNPLFGLANNKELQGDTEKVLKLIDAYDRTLSDASNEIEQYRLAYLVWKGVRSDPDVDKRYVREIELLGEHDDVSYLTKDINDALIEHHLDRLEKNILRFAKSVDFTDEQFGGNVTGVALQQKLRSLETKCITSERKFVSTLRYQYKVFFSARSMRANVKNEDYLNMFFTFTRNNPVHLLEEAQATQALKGNVSEETRLSALSIVDDVQYELKKMEEEQQKEMDAYNQQLGKIGDVPSSSGGSSNGSQTKEKDNTCPTCGGTGKEASEKTGDQIICRTCGGDGVVV
jgi:SPP1 family phage portal protein